MARRVLRLSDAFGAAHRSGAVRLPDGRVLPLTAVEGGGGHVTDDGRPLPVVLADAGLPAEGLVPVLVDGPEAGMVVTPCATVGPDGLGTGWLSWEPPPRPALPLPVITDDLVRWQGHAAALAPLFVYGTLQPGESRWFALRDAVAGAPRRAEVAGAVWDTGYAYPAWTPSPAGIVPGQLLHLRPESAVETWRLVVEIEGGVTGVYVPALVLTATDEVALAFLYDDDPTGFVRIAAWDHGPVPLPG